MEYHQGSGRLGSYLAKALQTDGAFELTVVSRQSSTTTAGFPPNTNIVKVGDDYPKKEMLDVFKGQDAIILSINFASEWQHHKTLIDASVEAGIKRVIAGFTPRVDVAEVRTIFPIAEMQWEMLEYAKSRVPTASGWSWTSVTRGYPHNLYVLSFYHSQRRTN